MADQGPAEGLSNQQIMKIISAGIAAVGKTPLTGLRPETKLSECGILLPQQLDDFKANITTGVAAQHFKLANNALADISTGSTILDLEEVIEGAKPK